MPLKHVLNKQAIFKKTYCKWSSKLEHQNQKEPEKALEDEFKDSHLNLPVLEVLAHALMYNAIMDNYVKSLELGKNSARSVDRLRGTNHRVTRGHLIIGYEGAVIGGGFAMTKMPLSTHLGYKRTDAAVVLGVRFLVYFHSSVGARGVEVCLMVEIVGVVPMILQREQAANVSTHTPDPSRCFNIIYDYDDNDDDDEESTIPLNEITSKIPPITPVLLTMEPEDSLIMGDEDLSTIPKKESECDLPSCNDFSPINISEEKSINFSNPLFDSNDDFTSSDDESLSDEDVPEDNVKIYSNPLFVFDDEYISSDVNPLFSKVLEDIESEDSYVSKLDETDLLVTPLFKLNEDECFDLGGDVDEIELLLHRDPSTPKISVASILEGFTDEPPLVENDDLFDLESKENEWKKILYDAPWNGYSKRKPKATKPSTG
ncbi:hypothetical protein Tco_0422611 [Tanacetum coccineum]